MPVYNGDTFLAAAISSILAQTFDDFELIISDNGSSDRTEEICRQFAASDPRIRYIRQPKNLGAARNFNFVLQEARGRYFKWAAHDDLIEPDFVEKCVAELDADQKCILAFPRTILIDESGDPQMGYLDLMNTTSDDTAERFRRYMVPHVGEPNPIFGVMRRDIVAERCEFGNFVSADLVFLGHLPLLGTIRLVDEPLFLRRIHPGISVNTHPDHLSREEWFTGQKAKGLRFRNLRLIREFARLINSVQMSKSEWIRCYVVLMEWAWRGRQRFLKEFALPFYANGFPTRFGQWVHARILATSKS